MDWKIAATLIICAGILVGAFLATSGPDMGSISGFFTAFSPQASTNISFSAILAPQDVKFNAPAESITVKWSTAGVQWSVGTSRLDLGQIPDNAIVIEGWNGEVEITASGLMSMDGTADKVTVNGMTITQGGRQAIKISRLEFREFSAQGLRLQGLKLATASGAISIADGKATFQAAGEPLEIGAFSGSLTIDSSFKLLGGTNRLTLSGKNRLSISQ